jgi:hypothetical protein
MRKKYYKEASYPKKLEDGEILAWEMGGFCVRSKQQWKSMD